MTQNVSSRAHASLVKPYESSVAFYSLIVAISIALILSVTFFMVIVSNAKDPFISPPVVVITMVIPVWIGFGLAMRGYSNACYNHSVHSHFEKDHEVPVHKSA